MKVFMLGWEFPPMVSGGLGVACYGLSKALNSQGVDVLFLLPKPRKAGPAAPREARTLAPLPVPPPSPLSALGLNGNRESKSATQIRQVPAATRSDVQHAVEQAARSAIAAADRPPAVHQVTSPPTPAQSPVEPQGAGTPAPSSPPEGEGEMPFAEAARQIAEETTEHVAMQRITFVPLDAWLQPYMSATQYQRMVVEEILDQRTVARWETDFENTGGRWMERARAAGANGAMQQPPNHPSAVPPPPEAVQAMPTPAPLAPHFAAAGRPYIEEPPAGAVIGPANSTYAGDLFSETERYARLALAVARGNESFDVVHAHDWMTFEAAMAVASDAHRPLIVQIHSTELDRAGSSANPRIMEIERLGMTAADAVIAVSYKTKTQLIEKYGIDPRKIEVVYNATDATKDHQGAAPALASGEEDHHAATHQKTVLFLGRLTHQKGPGYFLHAARKVLSVEPDVRFVMAGKGDMEAELKTLATELGIRKKIVFAGFLKKEQAQRAFQSADVYVMPSVSEPFGIAPLEALAKDVPVIISKQSGVAEVLRHVLKVDFWDTDDLANKILAILRHAPLAATLREHGQHEARQLSWDDSAHRIIEVYERLSGMHPQSAAVAATETSEQTSAPAP